MVLPSWPGEASSALSQGFGQGLGGDLNQRDKDRNTPLMLSILFGRADAAKALIEGGAKLDLKNKDGNTALMSAAFLGQTEIVKILLEKGAELEIRSNVGSRPWIQRNCPGKQPRV